MGGGNARLPQWSWGPWPTGGRIKQLKDIDRDGVYDQETVFLDHIPFPSGIHAWENGWWISA
ncbi:MAG: DUF7133 domain-containing protein, partial [Limisphaerales bacterium]